MKTKRETRTERRVNEAKRYMRATFREYKQTILSRGTADDIAIAKISDDLVDAVCNRGLFDKDGCLVAVVQYKESKKRN